MKPTRWNDRVSRYVRDMSRYTTGTPASLSCSVLSDIGKIKATLSPYLNGKRRFTHEETEKP